MSNEVIVLVSDLDDANHGEVNTLGSQEEASKLIESLLESGFEKERIRAFQAKKIALQVSHRPVVALVGGGQPAAVDSDSELSAEKGDESPEPERELVAVGAPVKVEVRREVAPRPFIKDGVRFSSLFRPA